MINYETDLLKNINEHSCQNFNNFFENIKHINRENFLVAWLHFILPTFQSLLLTEHRVSYLQIIFYWNKINLNKKKKIIASGISRGWTSSLNPNRSTSSIKEQPYNFFRPCVSHLFTNPSWKNNRIKQVDRETFKLSYFTKKKAKKQVDTCIIYLLNLNE